MALFLPLPFRTRHKSELVSIRCLPLAITLNVSFAAFDAESAFRRDEKPFFVCFILFVISM